MTDGTGKVVWEQDYLPFGEDLHKPGTSVIDFVIDARYKFTGQRQVVGIGLYYYGARYYDPETGRFITEDVYRGNLINPLSQNLYIYVLQNPLKYVDPSGYMANLTAGTGGITSKITDEDIERLKKIVEEDDRLTEEEKVDLKDTFNQIKANNTEIENPDIKRIVELHIEGKISIDAYYIAVERIIQETGDIQKWQEYIWPFYRKVSNINHINYRPAKSLDDEWVDYYYAGEVLWADSLYFQKQPAKTADFMTGLILESGLLKLNYKNRSGYGFADVSLVGGKAYGGCVDGVLAAGTKIYMYKIEGGIALIETPKYIFYVTGEFTAGSLGAEAKLGLKETKFGIHKIVGFSAGWKIIKKIKLSKNIFGLNGEEDKIIFNSSPF
ncbi:hypothetical protein BBF96_08855 [Anoxybacter fermentans]|uniref:RHS repeat-associated core domain-containing protein n=1 Tax=Anoxybacter fermentans TaxID=1323375 RepID=A0A3Q9HR41_9FIRM|nr:RHS repeat-associated core domain-containing protein [Anoxybacter fermentans]AZR73482.1 hypothetical protein BBF96_08855 [Anoxybacter fermentans]